MQDELMYFFIYKKVIFTLIFNNMKRPHNLQYLYQGMSTLVLKKTKVSKKCYYDVMNQVTAIKNQEIVGYY